MADPAVDVSISATGVEGMEDLFTGSAAPAPKAADTPDQKPNATPKDRPSNEDATSTFWTLKEAADNLQVSINTVRKRLQQGLLEGFKVEGPYGPEWQITPPENCQNTQAIPEETQAEEEQVTSNVDTQSSILQIITYQETQTERLMGIVESQLQLISGLQSELMLKDRIIQQKDAALKLLVDTQFQKKTNLWQCLMEVLQGMCNRK